MRSISRFVLGFAVPALAFSAAAVPSYDGRTPLCEVPIFHWTSRPIHLEQANQHVLDSAKGAIEATQTAWNPDFGAGDLAGKGVYFEADPFSSESYGDHLVIAYLKPRQAAKDLRPLGELDDPRLAKKAGAAIRSTSPLMIHRWESKLGPNEAVVLRGKKTMKLDELPIDLAKTELVVVTDETAKAWQNHVIVDAHDSLSAALQKYADRLSDLFDIWNASSADPTDDLIWSEIKTETSSALGDLIGDAEADRSGTHWEPFDSCGDFETPAQLAEAVQAFHRKNLIAVEDAPQTVCELKAQTIHHFKAADGYQRLFSIYAYLQNLKHSLGVHPSKKTGDSTLAATCRPY